MTLDNSKNKNKLRRNVFIVIAFAILSLIVLASMPSWQGQSYHKSTVMSLDLNLIVEEADLQALEDALPQPPIINMLPEERKWVKAKLEVNGGKYDVEMRYRGDMDRHWRYEKKSMAIKFTDDSPFDFDRFSLVIPEDRYYYLERFNMYLANKLGLPVPWNGVVQISVNDENSRLYYMFESFKEPFLERNGLSLDGVIYNGDLNMYARTLEFEGEEIQLYDTFSKVLLSPAYFESHYYGIENGKDYEDYFPVYALLEEINNPVPDPDVLRSFFDEDNLFAINMLSRLDFSTHIDNWHNWKLYYDGLDQKFRFIPWDISDDTIEHLETYSRENYDDNLKNILFYVLNQDEGYHHEFEKRLESYLSANTKADMDFLNKLYEDFYSVYQDELKEIEKFRYDSYLNLLNGSTADVYELNDDYSVSRRIGEAASSEEFAVDYPFLKSDEPGKYFIDKDVSLSEDFVIPLGAHVVIYPGVTLGMEDNVSILSYGRLDFLGDEDQPIRVVASEDNSWGVVFYFDKGASGSLVNNVLFDHGGDVVLEGLGYVSGPLAFFNTNIDVTEVTFGESFYNDKPLKIMKQVSIVYLRDDRGDLLGFDIIPDSFRPLYVSAVVFYSDEDKTDPVGAAVYAPNGDEINNLSEKVLLSRNVSQFSDLDDWHDGLEVPFRYRFLIDGDVELVDVSFSEEDIIIYETDVYYED